MQSSCPIAGIERGEDALGAQFAFDELGMLGEVAPAPDGAVAGIGLLVFFGDGPVGIWFVSQAG